MNTAPLWDSSADSLHRENFEIVVMVNGAVQDSGLYPMVAIE